MEVWGGIGGLVHKTQGEGRNRTDSRKCAKRINLPPLSKIKYCGVALRLLLHYTFISLFFFNARAFLRCGPVTVAVFWDEPEPTDLAETARVLISGSSIISLSSSSSIFSFGADAFTQKGDRMKVRQ